MLAWAKKQKLKLKDFAAQVEFTHSFNCSLRTQITSPLKLLYLYTN